MCLLLLNNQSSSLNCFDTLMKYLDYAYNEADNTYYLFDQEEYRSFLRKCRIRKELENAIHHDFRGFDVYYQPIVDAKRMLY